MRWVTFLKHKLEAFEKFKDFKALVENDIDLKIKGLRSENGDEFTSNQFDEFCEEHGINRHFLATRTPQQNGVVERMNKSIQEMARTMLNESKLPYIFWREAVYIAVNILNRGQLRVNDYKTPYHLWKGRITIVNH